MFLIRGKTVYAIKNGCKKMCCIVFTFSAGGASRPAQSSGQDFQDLGKNLTELTESEISKYNRFDTVLSVFETINDVYLA